MSSKEQPDFRRCWKFIYDDGYFAMLAEATYPSQDEATLKAALRSYRFNHDEPIEKIQLIRLGLMAENYVDEVLKDNIPIPSLEEDIQP